MPVNRRVSCLIVPSLHPTPKACSLRSSTRFLKPGPSCTEAGPTLAVNSPLEVLEDVGKELAEAELQGRKETSAILRYKSTKTRAVLQSSIASHGTDVARCMLQTRRRDAYSSHVLSLHCACFAFVGSLYRGFRKYWHPFRGYLSGLFYLGTPLLGDTHNTAPEPGAEAHTVVPGLAMCPCGRRGRSAWCGQPAPCAAGKVYRAAPREPNTQSRNIYL